MSKLQIRPLGYALGAEVTGVDLTSPLDDATVEAILSANHEHLLLCFPGQDVTMDQFIGFARRFGEPEDNRHVNHKDGENNFVSLVTTKQFDGKPWTGYKNGSFWHTDRSYRERPTPLTFLTSKELPDVGGTTIFANQYMAYETLSPKMRSIVDGLSAIHAQSSYSAAVMSEKFDAVVHPVVKVHPETQRRGLFLGEKARSFVGMTEEESKPLLDYLQAHAVRYELCYRHTWAVHDLLMWDNRPLLHIAVKDFDMQRQTRHMWKCSLLGEKSGEKLNAPAKEAVAAV